MPSKYPGGTGTPYVYVDIQGLVKVQRRMEKIMKKMEPNSAPAAATKAMVQEAYKAVLTWIHVDTGAMKSAQRMRFDSDLMASVITSGAVTNPESGIRPIAYIGTEFARGGTHDTYAMVTTYAVSQVVTAGFRALAMRVWEDGTS